MLPRLPLLLLLIASPAQSWELIEAKRVDLTYIDFFEGGRDPLVTQNGLPGRGLGKRVSLNLDVDVATVFYFNNYVHGTTDKNLASGGGQFRKVGWQSEIGVRISPQFEAFFTHHSQHVMDTPYLIGDRWPCEDGVGFRIKLLGSPKPRGSVF